MKAIEIDWSKAPKGATHWEHEGPTYTAGWMRLDKDGWWYWTTSKQWEQYRAYLPRSRVAAMIPTTPWNGAGLPPVGTVCEGRSRKDKLGEVWGEVIVLARRLGQAVVSFTDCERLQWCGEDDLRPIRTPEQIAAEEREKEIGAIKTIIGSAANQGKSVAGAIYDAGYRKVEGDKQ